MPSTYDPPTCMLRLEKVLGARGLGFRVYKFFWTWGVHCDYMRYMQALQCWYGHKSHKRRLWLDMFAGTCLEPL